MGILDDIDEDPVVVVPAKKVDLDDLFGGVGQTSAAPAGVSSAPQSTAPQSSAAPAKATDALDDFFGGGNAGGAPAARPANALHQQPASDSLLDFSASPAATTKSNRNVEQVFADLELGGGSRHKVTLSDVQAGSQGGAARIYIPNRSMLAMMDFYGVLGVSKAASVDDISRSYKQKALALHPDKRAASGQPLTAEEDEYFKLVGDAYETLSDPELRATYDGQQGAGGGAGGQASWLSHVN
jgi:DnaJ-class molecular chaperone